MIKPSRDNVGRHVKVLLYGESSVGKTRLAATAQESPLTSPVLFVDFEHGVLTLHDMDLDVLTITDPTQETQLYSYLRSGKHPYKTVVFDPLNELQALYRKEAIETIGRGQENQQTWGKVLISMLTFMRRYRDLPMHTIWVCLSRTERDELGTVTTGLALSGQAAEVVPAVPDIVGYLARDDKTDKRALVTRSQKLGPAVGRVFGKDRSNLLPPILEDPSFPKLVELTAAALAGAKLEVA